MSESYEWTTSNYKTEYSYLTDNQKDKELLKNLTEEDIWKLCKLNTIWEIIAESESNARRNEDWNIKSIAYLMIRLIKEELNINPEDIKDQNIRTILPQIIDNLKKSSNPEKKDLWFYINAVKNEVIIIILHNKKDKELLLNITKKDIWKLARINTVWDMIAISEWKNRKSWDWNIKSIADFMIRQIKEELKVNPEEIKDQNIRTILSQIINILRNTSNPEKKDLWFDMNAIKNEIGIVLSRSQNLNIRKESNIDWLTWLLNRKACDLFLDNAVSKPSNYCVIIIDIDNFKSINDNYWHIVWDLVLKEISRIFKSNLRKNDNIARFWWEEFLILMENSNLKDSEKKMEHIRIEIENNLQKNVNNDTSLCDKKQIANKITISIWITNIQKLEYTWDFLSRADKALYKAKTTWKNKIETL